MPIGRIIGSVVAATLLGVAVHSGIACQRKNRELNEWQVARPMTSTVDLSKPGQFQTPFLQSCAESHAEIVLLQVSPPVASRTDAEKLLGGLHATLVVQDESGNEVLSESIHGGTVLDWDDKHPLMLARFHPFPKGPYTATFNVLSGAPALSGMHQTIYAEYQLCGLEGFPMLVAGAISFVTLIPGLVTLFVVARGFAKFGSSTCPDAQPRIWHSH